MFLDRVIHFRETLGDQVNARSTKKLKSLIEVHTVVHVKVPVLSFNMILFSCPLRVLRPSHPFRTHGAKYGKGPFPKKSKIFNRGCQCSPCESTCSKLQYDPYLISVACSYTKISISWKFGAIR